METNSNYLYRLREDGWYIKFYNWIYNVDAMSKYKTFCPFFWRYFFTLLFLPFVLLIKFLAPLVGTSIEKINDHFENLKAKRRVEKGRVLNKRADNVKTSKDAYCLINSSLYENYAYYLDYDKREELQELASEYRSLVLERKEKRRQKIADFKQNPTEQKGSFILVLLTGLLLITTFGYVSYEIFVWSFILHDGLKAITIILMIILVVSLTIGSAYLFIQYLLIPFMSWVFGSKRFCKFRTTITKAYDITEDMIRNWYTQNCPIIEWVPKENKEDDGESN